MPSIIAFGTVHDSLHEGDNVLCRVSPLTPATARDSAAAEPAFFEGDGVIRSITPSKASDRAVFAEAIVRLHGRIPYALNWKLVSCRRTA